MEEAMKSSARSVTGAGASRPTESDLAVAGTPSSTGGERFGRFRWPGLALLVAAAALLASQLVFGQGLGIGVPVWKGLYGGTIVAAGGFCVLFARRGERFAWTLIGVATVLGGVAQLYFAYVLVGVAPPPYPSLGDALWLTSYVPWYIGLFLLLRTRGFRFRPSLFLDGVIGALAMAAVGTAIVLGKVLSAGATSGSLAAVLTNLAYPSADMVLLALVAVAFALTGWRPDRSTALFGLGLMVFVVTDSVYLHKLVQGTYVPGDALGLGWALGPVVIALACAVPARRRKLVTPGMTLHVPPLLFAAIGLGVLVWDRFEPVLWISVLLAFASVVIAVARLTMSFGENVSLLGRRTHEAETDALTGLGNRRRLFLDLDQAVDDAGQRVLVVFDMNGFKRYNDTYGHLAGDELLRRLGGKLAAAVGEGGHAYRMGGDEFCVLADPGLRSPGQLVDEFAAALREDGERFSVSAAYGYAELPAEATEPVAALRLADQRMYANKASARVSAGEQSTSALLAALIKHAPVLDGHARNVRRTSLKLGQHFKLDLKALDDLGIAASLHDIGKVAIPTAILDKPGPLDDVERTFLRTHTLIGETIMQAAPSLGAAAGFVRSSHERFDGTGYPDRLTGQDIPLESRIISVCDAFEAMTTSRAYAPAHTVTDALDQLLRDAGTIFDPAVVTAFAALPADILATRNAHAAPTLATIAPQAAA